MHAYRVPEERLDSPDIAVVGLAVRLPGAKDAFDYWRNLRAGAESIRRLSEEELRAVGVPASVLHDPHYVRAAAPIDRLELFDAPFFGFSKREASVLDPQHRHFLEVCYEALENAGIVPEAFAGSIGVFGGSGMNAYMPYNLFTNPELMRSLGLFLARHTGNDKDFLTTRVSYCLDLKGPSVNVQTACSTSLVAIHMACQSLLAGECDAALAGGVTIELPHHHGYRYEEGEILSPDGHCRPFEAESKGTVFGSGAGVVVLKRLVDALRSGDCIHAVVKGSAVNNDGNRKVGYLAPSVDGQAECVVEALQVAGLAPRDISYVECHGTGTPVGDPIEVTALTQAFRRSTADSAFCGIGSVKSNIGHLDTAAGIASFVKVTQMLEGEEQVPTLHFERPNPQIDFPSTPFFVVGESRPWPRNGTPRRAGVSSLGVGGTNAHVILEEAPLRLPVPAGRKAELLLLSARSAASLDAAAARLARHLDESPAVELADVASTLLRGRRRFPFRRVLAAASTAEARALLQSSDRSRVFDAHAPEGDVPVVFLFPGGGAQHANMAREVYESEKHFRDSVDRCLAILRDREKLELAPLLFPESSRAEAASRELERPSLALPALFTIEIAFARLLESWGIRPAAMIGHSLGEYAAAHVAGVIGLEDALGIVCCRGRLFERVRGGMLSVALGAEALAPLLGGSLALAAVNAPELCVVSGENAELDALAARLAERGADAKRLHIDVPAHSPLLEPILDEFKAYLAGIRFGRAERPIVSNLSGAMAGETEISAEYFLRHLRSTVKFADGMQALLAAHPRAVLVEVGPGQTLASLARSQPARRPEHAIVPLSPHARDAASQATHLRAAVGRILAHGGSLDVDEFLALPRRIVSLPSTPFEHERHWVEPGTGYLMTATDARAAREPDVGRWFYTTAFREEPSGAVSAVAGERWLVLAEGSLARSLELELEARGAVPILVTPGERTQRVDARRYTLRLSDPQGYDDVLQSVIAELGAPRRILHALALAPDAEAEAAVSEAALDRVFFSLLHLAQVLGQEELVDGTELLVAAAGAYDVAGTETLRPLHALAQGPVLVIPREIPEIRARLFDILDAGDSEAAARALVDELETESRHALVARRGGRRYVGGLERLTLEPGEATAIGERPVVLVTGGLGGIGRALGAHLVEARGARLVLAGRSRQPLQADWQSARDRLDADDPRRAALDFLLALEKAGGEVMVEQADVGVRAEVEALVARVRERFGRIDVVIHAAGVLDDGPLALKDRASARAVLRPKVDGTQHLAHALSHDPPALFLLLSSTSAALGPPGQIDYAAANACASAFARQLARRWPRTRTLGLGFGVWRETGMAARVLQGYAPRVEGEPTGHPLVQRERRRDTGLEFESHYDTRRLWVLDEHRLRGGTPVVPGTAIVEMARAAAARWFGREAVSGLELRDVHFVAPLAVAEGDRRLARVVVQPENGAGSALGFVLTSRGREDKTEVEHARARVVPLGGPGPAPLAIAEIEARCSVRSTRFEAEQQVLPQDRQLAFGPRWRVIREMRFGSEEAVARLTLPERFAADLDVFRLHPALLDMLSGFAFSLADAPGPPERLRVPLAYQRLKVHAPLERELVSHVRLAQGSDHDGVAVFDVRVADPAGRVLLEIQGYTTKGIAPDALAVARQADREPSRLEEWSKHGIVPSEGVNVLERLLRAPSPAELFASPVSLYDMLEELQPKREPAAPQPTAMAAEATQSASVPPRDDVERRLAEMWTSLLGVSAVGIRDNFFELGGHSLIAVRLFARIRKAYRVDLPLAVLFQAPTIETCAEILRSHLGIKLRPANGSAPSAAPASGPLEGAFSHLVSIQAGNGRPPFFCIHGAGGHVLNFRELARQLGPDQPFFGVQAKGVGGETPASTIEEMAEQYREEIVKVQPHGPYTIGGYSGGGVVAYELAQRLTAKGEQVALLVLLDTFHPGTRARRITLRERIAKLVDEGPGYLTRRGKAKLSRQLDELSSELKLKFHTAHDRPLPLELRELTLTRAFNLAALCYEPRPYPGEVVLFRARVVSDVFQHMGPTLGWRELVPRLEIVEVPGSHDSLVLEPNVQVLSKHLARSLRHAANGMASATLVASRASR